MDNGKAVCSVQGCDRKAETHHIIPRSDGGQDDLYNIQPLCFHHHKREHSALCDWRRWGKRGGEVTASDPLHFMQNLPQYRGMSDREFDRWLSYYRNRGQEERPQKPRGNGRVGRND